ncbi:MAG: ABC transporter substrate-binding protein [Planctomycetota bacterium]
MRSWVPALLAAVCAAGLGCGRPAQDNLIIISPHPNEIRQEFEEGFADWYKQKTGRGVGIDWLDVGGTGEAVKYIVSRNTERLQAGGVDLFFGGGDYPFVKLGKEGLLVPHILNDWTLARIPPQINGVAVYQPDFSWYGAALSGFGIFFNKEVMKLRVLPLPNHWEDLARRECFGWVASGDPRYSGSMHMMYEVLLQAYGWEKGWNVICRLGGNTQTFTKGASSAAKDVSLGQAAYGLAIDFYAFIEIERYGATRLGFIHPEGETVITPDGIALLKGAPHPDTARAFIDYVMSDGQKLWILRPGLPGGPRHMAPCRFPVDATLYDLPPAQRAVPVNPYAITNTLSYDGGKGGRRWDIMGDLVAAYVITPHAELKACWEECIRQGVSDEACAAFLRVDVTEAEAFELAQSWGKPAFADRRVQLMNQWTRSAVERYRKVFDQGAVKP